MTKSAGSTEAHASRIDGGLRALIAPASIAVVGASDDPNRIGGRVLARLRESFTGRVVPVNPSRSLVQGLPAVATVGDLDEPCELAVIAAPTDDVVAIADACGRRGFGAILVLTAGFAESGEEGRRRQVALSESGVRYGMRICGPNCLGNVNLNTGMRASFLSFGGVPQRRGHIAVVSQSGAFGLTLWEDAQQVGLGVSYLFTTGNEVDATCAEFVGELVEREDVGLVLLFLETVNKPDVLLTAAWRALELQKPIIAIKAGRSEVGAAAAISHTGGSVGSDDAVTAAFERVGIVRVQSPAEAVELAKAFVPGRLPRGRRLGIITNSGGLGILMADTAETVGIQVPETSPPLRRILIDAIAAFGSARNPVDPTAQIINDPSKMPIVVNSMVAAEEFDMICISGASRGLGEPFRALLGEANASTDKPLLVYANHREVALELNEAGVPALSDPVAMIRAAGALRAYATAREALLGEGAPSLGPRAITTDGGALSEFDSRRLLTGYGIDSPRERLVHARGDAVDAARELGGAVVLKLSAAWLPHKSESGAVMLDLRTGEEIAAAFDSLAALAAATGPANTRPSVLVQEMIPRGIELICGAYRDPVFGPLVSVGLGGVLVDVLRIRRLALGRVPHARARAMLGALAEGRLVGANRGLSPTAVEAIADILVRLSELLVTDDRVVEVDINPVIASGDRVVAVDALVVRR